MTTSCVVVANASTAQIYISPRAKLLNGHPKLTLHTSLDEPQCRVKRAELVTDKAGAYGSGTFVESSDPKEHCKDSFAKHIAQILEKSRLRHEFDDLILIAPQAFDGKVKHNLSHSLKKLLSKNILKDYTHDTPEQLVAHMQDYL